MKIKMGVIGAGWWGLDYHATEIVRHSKFELRGIFDLLAERRQVAAQRFDVPIYDQLDRFLGSDQIDGVVIAVPPQAVTLMALAALNAEKAVIVEKPFAPSVRECDMMIEAAEKNDRLLTVHHNRRWDLGFMTVRKAMGDGLIGDVCSIQSHLHTFSDLSNAKTNWRKKQGGGWLIDMGAHMIDWVLCLVDSPVKTVFGVTRNRLWNQDSEDYFKVVLMFENGLVAQLDGSTSCRFPLPLWFVMGTKGTLVSENEATRSEGVKIATEIDGKTETYRPDAIPSSWASFYDNFAQAYRGRTDLAISSQSGREVVRVLEAAYKSAETGEVVHF